MLHADGPFSLAILQQSTTAAPAAPSAPATTSSAPPLAGQGTTAPGGATGQNAAPPSMFGGDMMFILLPVILVLILLTVLGPRKEQKRRNSMLKSMKKHDRVQTVGGVIGSITEIKSDTIVLKVDKDVGEHRRGFPKPLKRGGDIDDLGQTRPRHRIDPIRPQRPKTGFNVED